MVAETIATFAHLFNVLYALTCYLCLSNILSFSIYILFIDFLDYIAIPEIRKFSNAQDAISDIM